ncbi:MAG: histidine kinase [Mucilaginibacter sp.]
MKRNWQIFCHIVFWVGIVAYLMMITHNSNKISTVGLIVIFGLYGFVNIGLFYLNFLYLIPKFLNKKRYRIYTMTLTVTIIAISGIKFGIAGIFKSLMLHNGGTNVGFWSYVISTALTSLFFIFLSTALKFTIDWFLNERIQRDLENQRLSAELAFLKSQINPHFLFNSLNSIYSLAYQKSDTTPEAILKLSEIMRYMLYESNDNKVDLSKELQYLQNYIDLQKIRFGDNAFVNFKIIGEVHDQKIVPLILIAFIENAFKHGVANDPSTPILLRINLEGSHLHFYMENKKHLLNRDTEGGIGLNNVTRRLDLLYPGNYSLTIKDETDTYTCELSLIL